MTNSPKHKYALYGLKAKWEDEPSDQRVAFPRQLEPTTQGQFRVGLKLSISRGMGHDW